MADVKQLLIETLAQLDATKEIERHRMTAALESVCKEAKAAGETIPELRFELIAAYLALYDEPNVWETYFGPELSSIAPDGKRSDLPPLESITAECIAYWTARMTDAKHPALRARYGDLIWDLTQKATGLHFLRKRP